MKRLLTSILILALCLGTGLPITQVAAADLGAYSWAGEWDSNWGDMVFIQNGNAVTATYTYDQGKISGTVSGNTLTGTWSEAPSYAPPKDAGEVELTMSADGKSFTGKWRYGSEGTWGNWEGGTRITEVVTQTSLKTSSWAQSDINKADGYGLIPASLKDADLTKPITREEFAELGVRLYEKATGIKAAASPTNPFNDTQNTEILKAYKLRITSGTSTTAFSPNALITREMIAAMLLNAIKAIVPDGDFSTAGAPVFPDQNDISSWALESVKYITKMNIIRGIDGKFMPKATTTVQQAAGYGNTTREQAVLMSLRSFEQMDTIKGTSGNKTSTAPAPADASVVGTWTLGALSGGQFNSVSGRYEGGASGLGQIYTFKPDGTYTALVVWSNAMFFTGKYSVEEGVLTLTDRAVEESNDDGKTWGAKEMLPDTSAYFTAGTDSSGKYLLLGQEGATPPLVDKTNALKYR